MRRSRNTRVIGPAEPKLLHSGADFSLQLPGRHRARQRHAHQRAFPSRIFPPAAFHSRTADGARIRRRLYRYFLYGRGARRVALRHRFALPVGHVAIRLFSRNGPTPNLSTLAHRSPYVSPGGKSEKPLTSAETADATTIDELQKDLAKELPPGIDVEIDEQFDAMFSYKAKNYALLTKDGDVIIKGGALKSRGLEKFQRIFLEQMIKLIMQGKSEAVGDLRNEFEQKIRNREWKIEMLMKTDTLQDSLDKYRVKIAGSARNRAAAYELALASGRNYKPGDQISYYIKATPKKVPAYEAAKLASEFDPQNRDENVDYYIAKLDDLVKKFSNLTATSSAPKQETLSL